MYKKYEDRLLKHVLNEKYLAEDEDMKMSKDDRNSFLEAVSNFHKLGEMVYSNGGLQEVTKTLQSVVEQAEKVTISESEHWFDNVTTSRHMKQLGEAYKVFEKTAKEVHTLQQRLESAYEDMGGTLNKYYKISEALQEDGKPDFLDADKDGDTEEPMKSALTQKEDLNISAKAFKKMNHNKISKLARKTDINIED